MYILHKGRSNEYPFVVGMQHSKINVKFILSWLQSFHIKIDLSEKNCSYVG